MVVIEVCSVRRSCAATWIGVPLLLAALFAAASVDALAAQTDGAAPRPGGVRAPISVSAPVSDITGPTLLDAPVSRTGYLLGPGDQLDISLFGEINQLYRLPVTPEGTVVIPGVGVADLLGLNLQDAETRVRALVLRNYQNVETRLTLAGVRAFKVFVVGDVPLPGVRIATAATRVSEVVPTNDTLRATLPRNIVVRRAGGDTVQVDLARFRLVGDLTANPTLREGDAVVVPAVDETVRAEGQVAYPGLYEFRRGETLAEFLTLVNGDVGFPAGAADTIRVGRFTDADERRFFAFSAAAAQGPSGRGFVLEPFDAVYVPRISDYKKQKTATIVGEVEYPGTYPIRPDMTSVRDLVALAGGFTPDASLSAATLQRTSSGVINQRLEALRRLPPELLTSEERRLLQATTRTNANNVVIDFQQLFARGEDAYNQALRSGDTLFVPERRNEVVILGAVLRPGIVQYVPNRGANYFVSLAGGYDRKADRGDATVVKAGSGARVSARSARAIESGDVIIVPFEEKRNYLQTLQITSSVVTTVVGLILAYRTVFP